MHELEESQRIKFQKITIAVLGLIIVGLVFVLVMFWIQNQTNSSTNNTTQTNTTTNTTTNSTNSSNTAANSTNSVSTSKTGSEVVSVNDTTQKYVNYDYGFSITIPKVTRDGVTCSQTDSAKAAALTDMKVFEDATNKTVYIADATAYSAQNKKLSDGTYEYDASSCKVITNTIDTVKAQLKEDFSDFGARHTLGGAALKFVYATVNNDDDLWDLFYSFYSKAQYPGCSTLSKKLQDDGKSYDVSISGNSETCFLNFAMPFFYSKENKLGIIGTGTQAPYFQGTNNQSEPKVEFVTK